MADCFGAQASTEIRVAAVDPGRGAQNAERHTRSGRQAAHWRRARCSLTSLSTAPTTSSWLKAAPVLDEQLAGEAELLRALLLGVHRGDEAAALRGEHWLGVLRVAELAAAVGRCTPASMTAPEA